MKSEFIYLESKSFLLLRARLSLKSTSFFLFVAVSDKMIEIGTCQICNLFVGPYNYPILLFKGHKAVSLLLSSSTAIPHLLKRWCVLFSLLYYFNFKRRIVFIIHILLGNLRPAITTTTTTTNTTPESFEQR